MHRIRLSIPLPAIQLPLAIALWEWGDRFFRPHLSRGGFGPGQLVCYGINAPAIFLRLIVFPFTRGHPYWPQLSVMGYSLEDLSFFLGVAILWFLVGKWLDRRRLSEERSKSWMAIRALPINLFLIALGLFIGIGLLLEGVDGLRIPYKWGDYWGTIIESVFFLVWSVAFVVAVGMKIAKLIPGVAQR